MTKLLPCILFEKKYLYFSMGNGQPREPALCQLYRHIFVPYFTRATLRQRGISCRWCLPVCVCHKSKYYRNGWFFWHESLFRPVLRCVGYNKIHVATKNTGTSLWNFVLNCGLGKVHHAPHADTCSRNVLSTCLDEGGRLARQTGPSSVNKVDNTCDGRRLVSRIYL